MQTIFNVNVVRTITLHSHANFVAIFILSLLHFNSIIPVDAVSEGLRVCFLLKDDVGFGVSAVHAPELGCRIHICGHVEELFKFGFGEDSQGSFCSITSRGVGGSAAVEAVLVGPEVENG